MSDETRDVEDEGPLVESDPTVVYEPTPSAEDIAEGGRPIDGPFRFALVVERGPRAGLAHVLREGDTLAGRAEDADIFLGDVTVSRHHAKFTVDGGGLVVEDLGSTNGTYINRERRDRAELRPGDEVIIGKFHLIVTMGAG